MSSSEPTKEVPTDPAIAPGGGEDAAPSKKGAKKAEAKAKKEAEKARKAAEREAAAAAQSSSAAEDLAKENYGPSLPSTKISAPYIHLRDIAEEHVDKVVQLQAWIQNSRAQGAKMMFVELREEGNWAVQGVVAASADGKGVSKQMVKWVGGVSLESFVLVEATVKKPLEPVKSCKVSEYELHLSKIYVIAPAPEKLGITFAVASRAVGRLDEEEVEAAEGVEGM